MKRLVTLVFLGSLAATAGGCGRPFAASGGSGSGGAPPSSSGSGATGGSLATDGSDGGDAAPACQPGVVGSCDAGMYCDATAVACRACDDLGRLHFHAPFALGAAPSTAGTTAFYPRVSPDDGALYFTFIDKSGAIPRRRIASAPRELGAPGWAWGKWLFLEAPVGSPGHDSGPLLLHDGSLVSQLVATNKVDTAKPVILFDSNRDGATGQAIFAANLDGFVAAAVALPSGKHDADIAAAPGAVPPRFYWITDAGSVGRRLVTATDGAQATDVTITLDNGCATSAVEGPWVTLDGQVLLFAAAYPAPPLCAPPSSGTKHLFATRMGAGMQPPGETAHPLFPDDAMIFDATPALTPDRCMLLFARFDQNSNGRMFGALRD